MAELYPYPRFSLAERDRRWKAVRELMREHRLDVIVTPQNSGHSTDYQANSRYLTHVGGGGDADVAAVFPLDGEVTAIATSAAPRWPTVQDWTRDVREARRNYGRVIVERLKELNVERGRIGITGLGDVEGTRTPEGTIFYGTWKQIREAFPWNGAPPYLLRDRPEATQPKGIHSVNAWSYPRETNRADRRCSF